MANINEEARIPVYINDEQAKSALKNLQNEADKWRRKMFEAMEGGDFKGMKDAEREMKKAQKAMSDIKREAFDVNKVLQNISNASTKDLKKALAAVNKEMEGLNRSSKEYQALMNKKLLIKDEFSKINGSIKTQGGLLDGIKEMLPAMGWAAMSALAVAAFSKIINITDTLGTKWEAEVNGMKEGLNEFWRTIATGDWSNFTDRMQEAINMGQKYIYTLDDIEEKTRALDIIEAKSRAKELELEEKLRNKTLSKEERIKAGQERIKIEEDLSVRRMNLAQQTYDNEANLTAMQTKLSKDQLETIVGDMDSSTKIRAKAYNDQLDQYNKLAALNKKPVAGTAYGGATWISLEDTPEMLQLKKQMDMASAADKLYGDQIRATGKTTDEQLDKMVAAYVRVFEAQNSAKENTKRVTTQVNSLLAGQEETGQKIEDKATAAQKKAIDKRIESAQAEYNSKLALIKKSHLETKGSEDQYNADLLQAEFDFLNKKLSIYKVGSKEYEETQAQFQEKQVQAEKEVKDLLLKAEKELADAKIENLQDGIAKEKAIEQARWSNELNQLQKQLNTKKNLNASEVALNDAINQTIEEKKAAHLKKMADLDKAEELRKQQKIADGFNSISQDDTSIPFFSLNLLQEYFDNRRSLLEQQYEFEKKIAGDNQKEMLAAEERYHSRVRQLNENETNAHFEMISRKIGVGQAYMSALADIFGQETALGKALFLFTQALAIADVWVKAAASNAIIYSTALAEFAWLGPGAPAAAAAFAAVPIAANNTNAALQTGLIVAQTIGNFIKGKAEGGYTTPGSIYQPAGIVHAGEYVIPQDGVNNARLRPVIDLIEIARRNGSLARLDLRPVVAAIGSGKREFVSGGSTSSFTSATRYPEPGSRSDIDPELKQVLADNTRAIREFMKWKPTLYNEDIRNGLNRLDEIDKNSGL